MGRAIQQGARVRHLTSVHPVTDNRIVHRECRSLANAGHDVALIAGHPQTEPVGGVRIIGVREPGNRRDRILRVGWRVYRAARRERADIYHLHDPELLWVGLLLKLGGRRVIYDVHEDVPKQIMNKFWIPWWAKQVLAWAAVATEALCGALFDSIVAATPAIAERFPARRTVVVQNFPPLSASDPDPAVLPFEERPYAFAYTGGLTRVQGIREITAVAALLPPDMGGVLAGWFDDDELEAEVRASEGWQAVRYRGTLGPAEVLETIRSARCGVVLDHPISNYLDAYSTKMFEYMACGVPVVCSNFPLWERLVRDADCGVLVDPLDPAAAAAAIKGLVEDSDEARRLGANGRAAVRDRYNWENEFVKLDELYRGLA